MVASKSFAAIYDHEPRPGRDRLAACQLCSADLTVPLGLVPDVSHQVERNLGRAGDLLLDDDMHDRDATRPSAVALRQLDAGRSKQEVKTFENLARQSRASGLRPGGPFRSLPEIRKALLEVDLAHLLRFRRFTRFMRFARHVLTVIIRGSKYDWHNREGSACGAEPGCFTG